MWLHARARAIVSGRQRERGRVFAWRAATKTLDCREVRRLCFNETTRLHGRVNPIIHYGYKNKTQRGEERAEEGSFHTRKVGR